MGRDTLDPDSIQSDDVPYYEADAQRMQSYVDARASLSQFDAPVFLHADDPHEYLFVAAFDGTGNDRFKDPVHLTNVGRISRQIELADNSQVKTGYVAGPGTQDNFFKRTLDGMLGFSYDARAEQMVKLLADQAKEWRRKDPQAQIRIAAVCFSRGCEELAAFTRIVDERGIPDPSGTVYRQNADGLVARAEYTRPALVAPGQVPQAVLLFDPVGTGTPEQRLDRRLPSTVISGVQLSAMDERRSSFKLDRIIDPGVTADGRFLGVNLAGAHCDIGRCYARDGLGILSGNLGIDFINGLSDRPFLVRDPEPDDPTINVVHRSEDGMLLYRILPKVNRANSNGYVELLVPADKASSVLDPYNAEPRDETLNRQFERQRIDTDRPSPPTQTSIDELSARLDRLTAAAQANDWEAFSRENRALAYGPVGQAMLDRAAVQVDLLEQQAIRQAASQQAIPSAEEVLSR